MEQRPHVRLVEVIPGLRRPQEPRHVGVRHHAALRPARRPRRVDHIGHVLRHVLQPRVPARLPPQHLGVPIHTDHLRRFPREPLRQPGLRDDDPGRAVRHHEGQPFRRIRRIQRQIGPPGLQNPQNPHHHLPPHPRHRLRRPLDLLFEQLVLTLVGRELRGAAVPVDQEPFSFAIRQHRHVFQAALRRIHETVEHSLQVADQLLDAAPIEPIAQKTDAKLEPGRGNDGQHERIIGLISKRHLAQLDTASKGGCVGDIDRVILEHIEVFEQWRAGPHIAVPLDLHQRAVFVAAHRCSLGLQGRKPVTHGRLRRELDPEGERVDERTDHRFDPRKWRGSARNRHPENDILLPAVTAQQQGPAGLHQRIQRQLMLPRERFQALRPGR